MADWTLNTAHCILPPAQCTLHTAHCTLHTLHCTLNITHYTLHTAHCLKNSTLLTSMYPPCCFFLLGVGEPIIQHLNTLQTELNITGHSGLCPVSWCAHITCLYILDLCVLLYCIHIMTRQGIYGQIKTFP